VSQSIRRSENATVRHLVFVYGTLKRGGENHRFVAGQTFLGVARTQPGYRLYRLSGYPGMVEDPTDERGVAGEVWAVDHDALRGLDELEGVAERLYERAPVRLQPPFDRERVDTYLYLRSLEGRTALEGEWSVP
jgi:gamma-glutamylaminecyclotransferase